MIAGIKILVVEDDQAKLREILSVVSAGGAVVDVSRDQRDAQRRCASVAYDLAIVDIALPVTSEADPTAGGGLDLLEVIEERSDVYNMPAHIVGLTAYEEIFDSNRDQFESEAWSLIHYRAESDEWRERVSRIVRRIRLSKTAAARYTTDYGAFGCVVTALKSPELEAVLATSLDWVEESPEDDVTTYYVAADDAGGAGRRIVAACAVRVGIAAAASLTMKMIRRFKPRYVAMAGITAGMKGVCDIGDVIVADPSWHYESGKHVLVDGAAHFSPEPDVIRIDRKLRHRVERVGADAKFLAEMHG